MQGAEPIECVFSTDNNYCQHLAVALISLIKNNQANQLSLHIIHHDVHPANLALLREMVESHHNVKAVFVPFDSGPYQHFRLDGHITLASYFRLFLTDILPSEIERVLYLDADIVVLGDISPLWNTPLNGALIGAVPNLFSDNNARLGLPLDHEYFNAGVLIIDLEAWRSANLLPKFISYVEENHEILELHDQDTLNALLHDKIHYLDYNWNFQARTVFTDVAPLKLTLASFERMRKNPDIVHFTTRRKPWFYTDEVPYEHEYLHYLNLTPWRGYVQPDKTAAAIIRRSVKRSLPMLAPMYRTLFRSGKGNHSSHL